MSVLDKDKQNKTEASEELVQDVPDTSQELTELETELFADMENSDESIGLTATWHFELSDILNAIEHIDQEQKSQEPTAPAEPEEAETAEVIEETEASVEQTEPEMFDESEPVVPAEPVENEEIETSEEPETPVEPEEAELLEELEAAANAPEQQAGTETPDEPETGSGNEPETVTENPADAGTDEKPKENLLSRFRRQDEGTKKLVLTDFILLAVIAVSLIVGLVVANSLVTKAKAANEEKIAELKANVKEVDLAEYVYDHAAEQVIEDVGVPTYTLEELYALDLREPTGFTVEDLKLITRKGLVGCEEAFVEAEEKYGVNSIFLVSIASLESAYGTQMFRPNNMFGYGRTGFSSKQECIMTVAKGLGTRYLKPGGGLYGGSPTLKGVNKRYAANPKWYYKVGKYMQGYYAELAAEKNGALDKFK